MEMRFMLRNMEQIKSALSELKGQVDGSKAASSELFTVIQKGSGQVYTKLNEAYRMLVQVENVLYELIETTEIVISNTNETVQNTDEGIADSYEGIQNKSNIRDMINLYDFTVNK